MPGAAASFQRWGEGVGAAVGRSVPVRGAYGLLMTGWRLGSIGFAVAVMVGWMLPRAFRGGL